MARKHTFPCSAPRAYSALITAHYCTLHSAVYVLAPALYSTSKKRHAPPPIFLHCCSLGACKEPRCSVIWSTDTGAVGTCSLPTGVRPKVPTAHHTHPPACLPNWRKLVFLAAVATPSQFNHTQCRTVQYTVLCTFLRLPRPSAATDSLGTLCSNHGLWIIKPGWVTWGSDVCVSVAKKKPKFPIQLACTRCDKCC